MKKPIEIEVKEKLAAGLRRLVRKSAMTKVQSPKLHTPSPMSIIILERLGEEVNFEELAVPEQVKYHERLAGVDKIELELRKYNTLNEINNALAAKVESSTGEGTSARTSPVVQFEGHGGLSQNASKAGLAGQASRAKLSAMESSCGGAQKEPK